MASELTIKTRHISTLWRALQGELMDMQDIHHAVQGLYDKDESQFLPLVLSQRTGTAGLFNAQTLQAFKTNWQSLIESGVTLSAEQIQKIGVELRHCAEHPDSLMGDRNLAGESVLTEGEPSDSRIFRPAGEMRGWTLTLTVQGSGDYNCIRTQLITGLGDLVLHSPEAVYDCRRADLCEEWSHYWLYFQQESRFIRWLQWQDIGPNIYFAKVPEVQLETIKLLFERAFSLASRDDLISVALLENKIEEILIHCFSFVAPTVETTMDERVETVKAFVLQRLEQDLSIHTIAESVGLSKPRLSSLFKAKTGQTVFQWRDERRIAKASQLLMETDLSIKEIAQQVGYSDPLYFSKCFKKLVNMNPTRFRRG